MKQPMKCPICGKLNVREYEMEECKPYAVKFTKYDYHCRFCNYWYTMGKKKFITGFSKPKSIKQWFYFLTHIHKAIENGFKKFEETC